MLSNVRLTGTTIGAGAYGSVEEVAIPGVICAAKNIHEIFLDRSEIPPSENQKEPRPVCERVSTDEHPPPPEHRPVPGSVLLSRLATARTSHGATAHEPSRLARPGNRPAASTRRAQTVLPAQPKVFHTSQRGQRPSLPPRAS